MTHAVALALCYFSILAIAAIVWGAQSFARWLDLRRYRARVVTLPIRRGLFDMPPARRKV